MHISGTTLPVLPAGGPGPRVHGHRRAPRRGRRPGVAGHPGGVRAARPGLPHLSPLPTGHRRALRRQAIARLGDRRRLRLPRDDAAWLLHRVPDGVPDEVAVLAEPMAVTMTALRRGSLPAGDAVLIIGPGPVGSCWRPLPRVPPRRACVVAGRSDGARLESPVGWASRDDRRGRGRGPSRARTGGRGADLVLEATGTDEASTLRSRRSVDAAGSRPSA